MLITPVENQFFCLPVLTEASVLIHNKHYSQLTDNHLAHLAAYDAAGAQQAARAREMLTAPAPPAPTAAAPPPYIPGPRHDDEARHFLEAMYTALSDGDLTAWEGVVKQWGDWRPPLVVLDHLIRFVSTGNARNKERNRRLDAQDQRIADLEAKALTAAGTWTPHTVYRPGSVVQRSGASWVARRDTSADPHTPGCTDWQLLAAKGRDAR